MIFKPRHERRVTPAALLLLAIAALALLDLRSALELAPAALFAVTLYLGYRPGERLIERIHEARRRRLTRRPARAAMPRLAPVRVSLAIRRLACSALAMRPPPALRFS
jgi:hypothetical protein